MLPLEGDELCTCNSDRGWQLTDGDDAYSRG